MGLVRVSRNFKNTALALRVNENPQIFRKISATMLSQKSNSASGKRLRGPFDIFRLDRVDELGIKIAQMQVSEIRAGRFNDA
jgi:hypothetical protein